VLTPLTGYYVDPVVTFDYNSLYPSVMRELNICASTRLTRADALLRGIPFLQPPAPALEGVWFSRTEDGSRRVARIHDESDERLRVVTSGQPERVGRYEDEHNEAIVFADGARAVLEDGGYALRWADGQLWVRRDEDVLVFVDPAVREGSIPRRQRTLKEERERAKASQKQAYREKDFAKSAFFDNFQNAVKLKMNALYGCLGSGKGGIYPDSAPLASAITARGRALIVLVKKTIEERFWLASDGTCGGLDGAPCPADCEPLKVLYGGVFIYFLVKAPNHSADTDSVMALFKGCSLQQAAEAATAIESYLVDRVLKPPQKCAFEKILGGQNGAVAFYKKKMYASVKFEDDYGTTAKGKLFVRGLSAIRRDNASITKDTVTRVMDMMFVNRKPRGEILEFCGRALASVLNSARCMWDADRAIDGRLPFEAFVQSAGISKDLDDYDADNAATAVARQLLEIDPQSGVGKSSRVSFVVTLQQKGSRRSQQAMLPSLCAERRAPIDGDHYVSALLKKLAPLLSVLFAAEARAGRRMRDPYGHVVEVAPASKAAQARLLGEEEAERAVLAAMRSCRLLLTESTMRHSAPLPAPLKKRKVVTDKHQQSLQKFYTKL